MSSTGVRRVLFSESSPNVGGQELQLLAQATGLSERGIQTLILCRVNSRLATVAATRGIATAAIPFRNSLHLPSITSVRRVLKSFRPDALICHSGHDANNCALAARLVPDRPALLRARTYQHGQPNAWTYNHLFDRTLVPSNEMRQRLLANRAINPQRIHLLYPGIDFATIARRSQETLPAAIDHALVALPHPLIVQAAMLRPEKGHALILDVLSILKQRGQIVGFAIAGEGELKAQLQQQVERLGLGQQVAFLGMVDNIPAVYTRATLVVVPSSYEPLGMSQIEALSLGIPVVVSEVGGIPETVRHQETGLIARSGDRTEWTAAIQRALIAPEEMRTLAQFGRADVLRRFGLPTNLDQLMNHIAACRSPK
ncbi:glycosyltransferase family 4 protein [Rhodoferax sp. 4810]|nr:glycosyltransferase family 4 protein [Rhodoferax jenense]